jgi:hypothetical protein
MVQSEANASMNVYFCPQRSFRHGGLCSTVATGGASVLELGAGRAIAVTTTKRLSRLPQVATFHE